MTDGRVRAIVAITEHLYHRANKPGQTLRSREVIYIFIVHLSRLQSSVFHSSELQLKFVKVSFQTKKFNYLFFPTLFGTFDEIHIFYSVVIINRTANRAACQDMKSHVFDFP